MNKQFTLFRSIATIRSSWVNLPKHRFLATTASATPSSGWKTQKQQPPTKNSNQSKKQESKSKQPLLNIDSPAAKAHKHLYTIPHDTHIAAQRVARIAKVASIEDALEYLKCLRIGLQSTAAWNTIMQLYGKAGKPSQAEKCFSQMRKRNIPPNEQTFTVLISAWGRSSSPMAVRNADYVIERMARYDIQPSIIHYNTLLLAYQKTQTPIDQVFSTLPCSPNEVTYSIAFQCADKVDFVKQLWNEIQTKVSHSSTTTTKKKSSLAEKAHQIKLTEESLQGEYQMEEEIPLVLDDQLVVSFLTALIRTAVDEDDYQLGIDTIEHLYGLHAPSSPTTMNSSTTHWIQKHALLKPTVYSLDIILRFCGRAQRYKLGREYYDIALKQDPSLLPDQTLLNTRAWLDGGNNTSKSHHQHHTHSYKKRHAYSPSPSSYINTKSKH
ncbi:hypothetical protein BDA99DRAFT_529717 [Phascolomyces articulosus]|uniref:Pentacotripeptide-repeat region of PRORP domain-containing protein n=1 Tax=Phascolomyces articulosus TaxID=60185 RepID=A0AAD5P7F0_9FUNG|nr:hypothetical protein BDA99DRAFT_529717 [Phascolomyces articulosus]